MTLEPGLYDLTDEAYHADPCPEPSLSAGVALAGLDQSWRHAWHRHPRLNPHYQEREKPSFRLGRALHNMILEDASRVSVVAAANWKTNAAKEQRAALEAAGRIVLLDHENDGLLTVERAVKPRLLDLGLLERSN